MTRIRTGFFVTTLFAVMIIGGCQSIPLADRGNACTGNCAKNWSNEILTVVRCARSANDAEHWPLGSEIHDALVDKVSAACQLNCPARQGCASHDTCTQGDNGISPGMLLAPGWSCSLVGPSDTCPRGKQLYSCDGKYASLRGNVFCKCTRASTTSLTCDQPELAAVD